MTELSSSTALILAKKALTNTIYIQRQLNDIRSSGGDLMLAEGNLVPAEDDLYDVGTSSLRYNDLYLSNSAVIGTISINNGGHIKNIAIGEANLQINTTGSNNIGIGEMNLYYNTTGNYNVAVGDNCAYNNITGSNNVAIGAHALYGADPGSGGSNVAIGNHSLFSNTSGSYNIALGHQSLHANTSGSDNISIGQNSSLSATNASSNVAIGHSCMSSNETGYSNVAIGNGAMNSCTANSYNVVVGYNAFVGAYGSLNIAIGSYAFSQGSFTNSTCLGANTFVTGNDQVQLGGAGTTAYVYNTVQNRSDARDKTDVRDTILGSDFIMALRPVDYKWDHRESYKRPRPDSFNETEPIRMESDTDISYQLKLSAYNVRKANFKKELDDWIEANTLKNLTHDGTKKRNRYHHGFIAQEVAATGFQFGGFQDHSVNGGDDVMTIGYDEFIAPLVKTVQELYRKVQMLEQKQSNEDDGVDVIVDDIKDITDDHKDDEIFISVDDTDK